MSRSGHADVGERGSAEGPGGPGVGQSTVSHHLRKLREAGLLTSERRGTWVYYRPAPGVLASLGAFLADTGNAGKEEVSLAAQAS
ncbi:ArsR family transcriptional regulator [Streptomyces sp. CB02980]|nr:ArsR family transcriptional regulator [Streptomyces sp. CB02980]